MIQTSTSISNRIKWPVDDINQDTQPYNTFRFDQTHLVSLPHTPRSLIPSSGRLIDLETMSFPPSPNRQGQSVRRPSQTMQTFGFHHTPSPSNAPVQSISTDPAPTKRKKLSHSEALDQIRAFLRSQSSYDVFPVSFRLIVLDHHLVVKKALNTMLANGRPYNLIYLSFHGTDY
jgi:hypothetical protein